MTPKPEFHLQRVHSDGSADPPQIYAWKDVPANVRTDRRRFMGAGLAASAVLTSMSGCDDGREKQRGTSSQITLWLGGAVGLSAAAWFALQKVIHTEPVINAHTDEVTALAVTPDGRYLASSSADTTIKIWTLPELRLHHTFCGFAHGAVIAISPDGKLLASGRMNGYTGRMAALSSLPAGKQREFDPRKSGSNDSVHALAISADGKLLAMAHGRFIDLWSLPDGKCLRTLRAECVDLAFTPDGQWMAAALYDHTVLLWSRTDSGLQLLLHSHTKPVYAVRIAPDGKYLLSVAQDQLIKKWSLPDGKLLRTTATDQDIYCLRDEFAMTLDGKLLIKGSRDGTVKVWTLPDLQLVDTCRAAGAVTCMATSPDSRILAAGTDSALINLWRLPDGKPVQTKVEPLHVCVGHAAVVTKLAVTPDGKTMISGDKDGVIILWNLRTGLKRRFAFDAAASTTDATYYTVVNPATGKTITFTLPCGSPVPAGATCVCNCVQGTYDPPASQQSSGGGGGGGGGGYSICTCVPVCQAHRLLHPDPVVRTMAEELLLVMGEREIDYMEQAAQRAGSPLRRRIRQVIAMIRRGRHPNPARWPRVQVSAPLLHDSDEVVCVMAAQMIKLHLMKRREFVTPHLDSISRQRVQHLLDGASLRPWYTRAPFLNDTSQK